VPARNYLRRCPWRGALLLRLLVRLLDFFRLRPDCESALLEEDSGEVVDSEGAGPCLGNGASMAWLSANAGRVK